MQVVIVQVDSCLELDMRQRHARCGLVMRLVSDLIYFISAALKDTDLLGMEKEQFNWQVKMKRHLSRVKDIIGLLKSPACF